MTATVKHVGGPVIRWGCFGFVGVGELYKASCAKKYHSILHHKAISSGIGLNGFQHDNDLKPAVKHCINYLQSKVVYVRLQFTILLPFIMAQGS